jgi:hypothetical protein
MSESATIGTERLYFTQCPRVPADCSCEWLLSPAILTNPVYAGAYTYGKTEHERYIDEQGAVRKQSGTKSREYVMPLFGGLYSQHLDAEHARDGLLFRVTRNSRR